MDPFVLTFYAVVCGLLSLVAPNIGSALARVAVGAVIGAGSAAILPGVLSMMN